MMKGYRLMLYAYKDERWPGGYRWTIKDVLHFGKGISGGGGKQARKEVNVNEPDHRPRPARESIHTSCIKTKSSRRIFINLPELKA